MNFTFYSSGKIWNCLLNLPFLHPHATISFNNSNTTTSVRIPLVDSTVRNNLRHLSFESNVKYESHTQLRFSDRQEWWSGSDRHVYPINVTADQQLSEDSAAQRRGVGFGVGAGTLSEDFWEHSNIFIKVS